MKKLIFSFVAIAVLTIGGFSAYNANATAVASEGCPNGCYANGNGCYCNGWYGCYREAGTAQQLQ